MQNPSATLAMALKAKTEIAMLLLWWEEISRMSKWRRKWPPPHLLFVSLVKLHVARRLDGIFLRDSRVDNRIQPPSTCDYGAGKGGTAASFPSVFTCRVRSLIQATLWASVLALFRAFAVVSTPRVSATPTRW